MRFARKCVHSKSSLVSYSLETAFSRQENHFLTACANGYFQEESRRETGGKGIVQSKYNGETGLLVQRGRLRG